MDNNHVWLALGLTVLAGLSSGLGGLFTYIFNKTNTKLLSVSLGFSAGVMIYVSFVEIFFQSQHLLLANLGPTLGSWINILAFFGGIFLIALIDNLIPSYGNPHESHKIEEIAQNNCELNNGGNLLRTGMFTALAIAIHNFPEGMATFVSTLQDPTLGIAIAIAIAIHNIPEGISVAIPVYCATGSRSQGVRLAFISGIAEPVGAVIAYLLLLPILNDVVFGVLFAAVAGIMVFISLDELLPAAREYGEHHLSIYGLILGMIIMAVSLQLFI